MLRARIIGTGSAVPEKVLTNLEIEKLVETSDEWIKTRTGISERRVSLNDSASELSAKASEKALASAGVLPEEIDLLVVGTVTPDMTFPSTACLVQERLGLKAGIPAFDLSAACSGFLYALDVADKYIKGGSVKRALVVGVDLFSRIIDWKDRSTCILFGDGAGAVVLGAENGERGVLSCHIHSDGRYWRMLYTPGSMQFNPFEEPSRERPYVSMKGNETFKIAIRTMEEAVKEAMDRNGLTPGDISLFIPHQANMRIINALKEKLGLPDEKVFTNIEKYGNTSAGSIPLALDEAVREGRIKNGDVVLFVSFGGGLVWGSAAVRW